MGFTYIYVYKINWDIGADEVYEFMISETLTYLFRKQRSLG